MAWVKDTKAAVASQHAGRAAEEGRVILLYRYDVWRVFDLEGSYLLELG